MGDQLLWRELIEKNSRCNFSWRSTAVQRKELITDPRANPQNGNVEEGWEGESGYLGESSKWESWEGT